MALNITNILRILWWIWRLHWNDHLKNILESVNIIFLVLKSLGKSSPYLSVMKAGVSFIKKHWMFTESCLPDIQYYITNEEVHFWNYSHKSDKLFSKKASSRFIINALEFINIKRKKAALIFLDAEKKTFDNLEFTKSLEQNESQGRIWNLGRE